MKRSGFAKACVVTALTIAAALTIGAVLTPASNTYASNPVDPLLRSETEVLTRQGIPPARASQAIALQQEVARTGLAINIEAALAGAFAGMW
jgi:hypothetical protein